jgi:hypothetical protein
MKKVILVLLALVVVTGVSFAQKKGKSTTAATSWTGYLVDKMCNKDITYDKGPGHTKECLLAEDCISTGFGVAMSDGKWVAFDKKGNDLAAKYLNSSKKSKGFLITVSGKLKGGVIQVSSLKDKS